MKNMLVAKIFYEIADMLEMKDVEFKPQAYRRAARSIESLSKPIEDVSCEGKLEDIPGVGKNIAEKIEEIVETGRLKTYENLKRDFPIDIEALLAVEGLGPKKIKLFYKKLGVKNLRDLERAAKGDKIQKLPGMGKKSEQRILESIKFVKSRGDRMLLGYVLPVAEEIEKKMRSFEAVEQVQVAGSIHRMKETIGDIDVLVVTKHPKAVVDYFTGLKNVAKVVAKGPARSTVRLSEGIECDLRVIKRRSFGSALMYFTGSKTHNIALRRIAINKGWKLNEYGLFSRKGNKHLAGATEKGIYKKLGMQYIEPEMRENTGEIEAAKQDKLPRLIGYDNLRGDLHTHTIWSGGVDTIEELARSEKRFGYEYVAITDHTKALGIENGMNERRLKKQMKKIELINKKIRGIRILKGAELNIDSRGKLDIPNKIIKDLDVVIASIHSGFRQDRKKITNRLVSAMENEHVNIISHPTGRKIQERRAYDVDIIKLLETSKRTGTALEINSHPERLDINAEIARDAVKIGCKLAINSDAHSIDHLRHIKLGIATARRGWVQKRDVINTMPLKKLMKFFKK